MVVVQQYPYCIEEDSHAVPLEDCWFARQQLFFKCHLHPKLEDSPGAVYTKLDQVYATIYSYIQVYHIIYCADAAAVDGRRGSNVYEVNQWLWQFWCGKPSLGGLSGEETQVRKQAVRDEWHMCV